MDIEKCSKVVEDGTQTIDANPGSVNSMCVSALVYVSLYCLLNKLSAATASPVTSTAARCRSSHRRDASTH